MLSLTTPHFFRACLTKEGFGHDGRVMVRNLPFTIFVRVEVGVAGLDLVAGGAHREFVHASIKSEVLTCERDAKL